MVRHKFLFVLARQFSWVFGLCSFFRITAHITLRWTGPTPTVQHTLVRSIHFIAYCITRELNLRLKCTNAHIHFAPFTISQRDVSSSLRFFNSQLVCAADNLRVCVRARGMLWHKCNGMNKIRKRYITAALVFYFTSSRSRFSLFPPSHRTLCSFCINWPLQTATHRQNESLVHSRCTYEMVSLLCRQRCHCAISAHRRRSLRPKSNEK